MQQLSIYKIFTLDIPHGNFIAQYNVSTPISWSHTGSICQEANGQFCKVYAPLQPLANPPSCITALYAKNTASISTRCSLHQHTL